MLYKKKAKADNLVWQPFTKVILMKFAVDSYHFDHFNKHGFIELEGLFKEGQLFELKQLIREALAKRAKISIQNISQANPEALFLNCRDFWRENDSLRKIILNTNLGHIAAELTNQRPLRIGFDLYLPSPASNPQFKETAYSQFLHKKGSLNELFCVQGIECGLLICLESGSTPHAELSLFSQVMGNGVYFNPTCAIDFQDLTPPGAYLLITYVKDFAVYISQPNDPHPHSLKRCEYQFGDRLNDKSNPIVAR